MCVLWLTLLILESSSSRSQSELSGRLTGARNLYRHTQEWSSATPYIPSNMRTGPLPCRSCRGYRQPRHLTHVQVHLSAERCAGAAVRTSCTPYKCHYGDPQLSAPCPRH
ncbi:hypothetical protein V8C42DRAFT_330881 [Trichoderma barbatum]